jgi:glycosyltransferase involved in cell wall biosynthesis
MQILLTADPEIPVPPTHYGGIERIIAGLLRGLRAKGHRVGLAAHPDSTADVDYFLPWPGRQSRVRKDTLANMRALKRAVAEFKPDLVHSFSRLWYLGLVLCSRLPKIMSYQREPSTRTVGWANRLARKSLRFTGCSEYICRLGRPGGGEWKAIHNFVDLDRFTFVPSVPEDAPLLFLSRVESIKGPHLAIDAARQAGRRLVIAGNHSATPREAAYWENQIRPKIDGTQVEYVGPVNDEQKNKLLGTSAALIVPIQWDEPFGIVFVEALACGTPIISCARGALPEIVDNGKTGVLVESKTELSIALSQVDRFDRAEARKVASERFAQRVIVDRYIDLYYAICS